MTDIVSFLSDVIVPAALADGPCAGVDCGAGGNPLPAFVVVAAAVLLEVASGLSVLFVVVGGAHLVLNFGNESIAEKGRKGIIYALIGFAIALASQAIISFAVARAGMVSEDVPHLSLMRIALQSMLIVFNVSFAMMMLFFGFKLVISRGQQGDMDSAKKGLTWTVAGALAINLSYALVRAVAFLGF